MPSSIRLSLSRRIYRFHQKGAYSHLSEYQGLNQMRKEFLRRMVNSIVKDVLSATKIKERFTELVDVEGLDTGDAHAELFQQARQYFRLSDIKGQFSELLLFNFLHTTDSYRPFRAEPSSGGEKIRPVGYRCT